MKTTRTPKIRILAILLLAAGIVSIAAVTTFYMLKNSDTMQASVPEQRKSTPKNVEKKDEGTVAADTTLGSGFGVKYPKGWTNVHTGAVQPESRSPQLDENVITSPSGAVQVTLSVSTNASRAKPTCTADFIQLKYVDAENTALPKFDAGRFVAYVVYFPTYKLYQYHVGLQQNTEAIRNVTVNSNTACDYMFSEFIEKESSIPNVSKTTTTLAITFAGLASSGQTLKPGITENEVTAKLSGAEYEQAKQIVRSLFTSEN